jgi:serine/threonine-protein kinase
VRDEARLLGLLQDDHILKVLELAKVDGRDAVLMEYVEGVDLAAIVEMGTRPPPRALAELGGAIAGALDRAHRAVHPSTREPLNVIHRDVKPANVMVTDRGNVKLLDFGVARARFESRESYTGQFVLGTLNYMAPEYIVTGNVSPAADIYGLALTLWEAACGDVFGQPKLRQDLHEARVEERLQVISGTHAELVPVLRQMLSWDPQKRPDGASVERAFIAATDMLRGTGLRSWAGDAVPKALAKERAQAKDECGLLGRAFQLDDDELSTGGTPVPRAVLAAAGDEASARAEARKEAASQPGSPGAARQVPQAVSPPSPPPPRSSAGVAAGSPSSSQSLAPMRGTGSTGSPGAGVRPVPGTGPAAETGATSGISTRSPTEPRPAPAPPRPAPARPPPQADRPRPARRAGQDPGMILLQGLLICGALLLFGIVFIVMLIVLRNIL